MFVWSQQLHFRTGNECTDSTLGRYNAVLGFKAYSFHIAAELSLTLPPSKGKKLRSNWDPFGLTDGKNIRVKKEGKETYYKVISLPLTAPNLMQCY